MKWMRNLAAALGLAAALLAAPAVAQNCSDHCENQIIDSVLRGQTLAAPATWHIGLTTTACSDSATGTEVTGGNYSRVAVTANMTQFAGTQSAGSTTASSGTGGQTSNNNAINFPTPSAGWGTVTHMIMMDAASGGNLWFCVPLASSKTINSGDTVSVPAGALTVTFQ